MWKYNQFSDILILINKMAEKEMGLYQRLRSAREAMLLQRDLADALMQVQLKEGKIQELQRMLVVLQGTEIEESIAVEEETQCSLSPNDLQDHPDLLHRLTDLLRAREEEGVGLHLACLEKEQEAATLKVRAQKAEEMVQVLQQELSIQQRETSDQEAGMDTLRNQNQDLRLQVIRLQSALEEREAELGELEQQSQNLRVLQENKSHLEHIIIQNQKLRRGHPSQDDATVRELLQREVAALLQDKDRMKKTINNYEWKLFCLETELDLSNKEKKQYKYVCDKHETRLADYEATAKQHTIKIFSLQEEVRALEEENRFYEAEVAHHQRTIEQYKAQLEQAEEGQREREAEGETVKELEYRLREKDEELKEIANYLKEKLGETHEARLRCSQLEKALQEAQRKIEKGEMEVYELEQCIFDHEEVMQKQTQKIDESTRQIDYLSGKVNELSLLSLLRTQECQEKLASTQTALVEKAQKNNDLSVELIEKENEFGKRMQEAQQQLKNAQEEINRTKELLEEAVGRNEHLQMLASTKDKEIDKLVNKLNVLETTVKEKEKIIQCLQAELKVAKTDFKEARLFLRRHEEELEELKEIMAVNEEKIKILKKESVENIETELTNQFQIEQLKKQLAKLDSEKQALIASNQACLHSIDHLKTAIKDLQQTGKNTALAIISKLSSPPEQTEAFEILADDEYEQMEDRQERERKEIMESMAEYCRQIDHICELAHTQ